MNYEIFLIQNNIDEINKLPNIEDLYDMDKESLLKLKKLFDKKFPKLQIISEKEKQKTEKRKNLSSNYNNIDLDLEEENYSDDELELREFKINADDENEIDLPRLYSFLLSEIKQREYQEGIVNFFLNEESLFKLTENNFILETDLNLRCNNNSEEESKLLCDISEVYNKENNHILDDKKLCNSNQKIFDDQSNGENFLKNFDPSEYSLKKIKEKMHSKSSKLAIKQMLLKSKQDCAKLLVGTNSFNNYSNSSSINTTLATSKRNSTSKIQVVNHSNYNINDKPNTASKIENGINIIANNFNSIPNLILNKKKSNTYKF